MKIFRVAVALFSAGLSLACAGEPDWDWGTAAPESEGLSAVELDSFREILAAHKSSSLLIIRHDKIIYEWYAPGSDAAKPHGTASLAKALVGGVSVAVGLTDGRLALDDRAARFVAEWREDPQKSQITIRQLGSHASGLADAEETGVRHEELTGWKGDFWKRLPTPNDPFSIARDKTPVLFSPGTKFQYSNPGMAMLAYVVTTAFADNPQRDLRSLLRDRVLRPIGVADKDWSIGYGQTVTIKNLPLVATWGGGNFTPRAAARVGRLMLRRGDWNGRRLLDSNAVVAVSSDAGTPGLCGIGWWSNNEGTIEKLPRDAFWGSGAGHQILLVIPSRALIVARFGNALDSAEPYDDALRKYFFEPLLKAIGEKSSSDHASAPMPGAPVPPSPVIKEVRWSPPESIVRQAKGSDNWPLTWADDDALYGAYGDGNGFEPFVPQKLSLGLAKITGGPENISGLNIRSADLEQKGDGKAGRKASGLLMVDGTLYLWARNAANSQLAWSRDHGSTWTWSDWKFTSSFGCPTFLNFGKNYAGAVDNFVYVYSPDSDNAYDAADRFVLARVAKDKITRRDHYEFFRQLDEKGRPIWTHEINQRGAVFFHPGKCYRSGITYNAALRRYLWCQILPASRHPEGPRFQGGFGIYDSPNPWGPWTAVFYTEDWDAGPGESSSLPTKWMSADGVKLHLVFTGNDSFAVRKATLILQPR